MIRCVAIDDEPLALNKLKRNILKFPYMVFTGISNVSRNIKVVKSSSPF